MQLKLPENIKRYRKNMGLTQEGLADALGVTIGAVSKWENGNNVPDILTLMELANLFNISMDELLSFDMSSKNVEDMCETIENFCHDHDFDRAVTEANNALTRYPHNFKILYTCANMYFYRAYENADNKQDSETAIKLFRSALGFLSQNTDPDISEYSIKFKIAELYSTIKPEKALELLKEINYDGCCDSSIAQILKQMGRMTEALDYYTVALLRNFVGQYTILSNAAIALAASGKKRDLKKAIEMLDTEMLILEAYSIPDKINYTHKLKTILLILKAWWLSCLGNYAEMEQCVKEAYQLAVLFDNEKAPCELSTSLKFYFSSKKSYSYDSVGAGAVAGVESIFAEEIDETNKKTYKYMQPVIECWNAQKGQS